MSTKTSVVKLSQIIPDENQPRKNFDPARLAELASSLKEHGIMNPLVVEARPDGKYLLVDGERRYRAATQIGLKEVPVIIQETSSDADRIIKQFHLQEQHQGWTPLEKALAVGALAQTLGLTVRQMAKTLAIPERTIKDYEGFYSLLERREYEKAESPVSLARHVQRVRKIAKKLYEGVLEKEFDEDKQRQLERRIIGDIKSGSITMVADFTKLIDVFTKEPDMIDKYLKSKDSVTKLYLSSDAKTAHHARNVRQLANILVNHINMTIKLGGVGLVAEDTMAMARLKQLETALKALFAKM